MTFASAAQKAMEHGEAAWIAMHEEGITPTPENYAVWYALKAGTQLQMNRTVEILQAQDSQIDTAMTEKLYKQFLNPDDGHKQLSDARTQMTDTLDQLMTLIDEASVGTSSFGQNLESFSGSLNGPQSVDQLKAQVSTMMRQTQEMVQQNDAMKRELESSAKSIDELNGKLEKAQEEARTDQLTKVANRRTFDEQLKAMSAEAMETGDRLCLAMADIDHFKSFNDKHGHRFGDQVLRLVANALKSNVKGRDLVARYGGEEFALVLPETELEHAKVLCNRIRQAVGEQKLINRSTNTDYGNVTLSLGLASYVHGEDLGSLIERADQALYLAKQTGRNKVLDETDLANAPPEQLKTKQRKSA